ncbi:MAG TPA: alpha/beta fold hydrolase [Flavobacterium sp.]|nr:alpha/beta fold hydrolase [Flavobacterium sp.]
MQKILFLHGALGSASNFDKLKELLQGEFEIYTLSFEGHGEREIPENDLTIPRFAEEVVSFLNEASIEKIAIFGYSMGGYVGLYLAKHFPERIEKLFTLATKLNWTEEGARKESAMLNPEIIKEKVPKYAAGLKNLHGENWEILMAKTAEMMLSLGKSPVLKAADFSQIGIPVQIAVGDKDVMVSIEESVDAYRKLPNARLLVLPNTQHPIERVNVNELAHQIKVYFN